MCLGQDVVTINDAWHTVGAGYAFTEWVNGWLGWRVDDRLSGGEIVNG